MSERVSEWVSEQAEERESERGRETEREKEGRERTLAAGGGGGESTMYGGRQRTKERRRGAAPFSRGGSIDASASFVDFRAENAGARSRPLSQGGVWRPRADDDDGAA